MSVFDRWGTYQTPCPDCGGEVWYASYDADCRGNPPSSGIDCQKCGRAFTHEEWERIAAVEMKKEP